MNYNMTSMIYASKMHPQKLLLLQIHIQNLYKLFLDINIFYHLNLAPEKRHIPGKKF